MLTIAMDGACRRNGKPDCVSAGAIFIVHNDRSTKALWKAERHSTNQRGEMHALLRALRYILEYEDNRGTTYEPIARIITDSEYIFNAMTKSWYMSWLSSSGISSTGSVVKNFDLWQDVASLMARITSDILFYHIKGHCISFGKVTASKLIDEDPSAELLQCSVARRYDTVRPTKLDVLAEAQELSKKNNGFYLPEDTLRTFVVLNTVVDALATKAVELYDRES